MEKKKIFNINSISKNELRTLMGKRKEFFEITSVSREDLDAAGFDTTNVDDDTMTELASKMADDYLEQLYWSSLKIIAECLNIPKKVEPNADGKIVIGDSYVVKECWDCDSCTTFYDVYYKSEDEVEGDYIGEISAFDANEYKVTVDGEIDEDNMLNCIESLFF